MADAEIILDARVGTDKMSKDLRAAARAVEPLKKDYERVAAAIRENEVALGKVKDRLKEIDNAGKSYAKMKSELTGANAALKEQEALYENIISRINKANAALDGAKGSGGKSRIKEAEANLKSLENESLKIATAFEKAQDKVSELTAEIARMKITPEIEKEAQDLTLEMAKLQNEIRTGEAGQRGIAKRIEEAFRGTARGAEQSGSAVTRISGMLNGLLGRISSLSAGAGKAISGIGGAVKTLAGGLSRIVGGVGNLFSWFKKLIPQISLFNRHSAGTSRGLGLLVQRILGIGASALIFNKLSAVFSDLTDKMGALMKQNDSLAASFNAIQVNLWTAFAPIWEAVTPALEYLMSVLANLTGYLAAFISMLGGTTYKAANAAGESLYNQAEGMDAVGEAAKKAIKQLFGFDEINQAITEEDSASAGSGGAETGAGGGLNFEEVAPPDDKVIAWLQSIIDLMKEWQEKAQPTLDAMKSLWETMKSLSGLAFKGLIDFYNEFLEPVGTWVLGEGLPRLIKLIEDFFKNVDWTALLADLKEFWAILSDITKLVFDAIIDFLEYFIKPIAEWFFNEGLSEFLRITKALLEQIDWENLKQHLIEFWDTLSKFSINIGEAVLDFYEKVLVPIAAWTMNEGLPTLLDVLTNIMNAIDWDTIHDGLNDLWVALQPFGTFVGDSIISFLRDFLEPLGIWVVGTGFPEFLRITTELFENIEWATLTQSVKEFFTALEPFAEVIGQGLLDFYEKVLVPLADWTIDTALNTFLNGLTTVLTSVSWTDINADLNEFYDAVVQFTGTIGDGLVWFYNNALVPLATWVLNEALPVFLEAVSSVIIGMDENLRFVGDAFVWLWENALKPLMGFIGDAIITFFGWIKDNGQGIADIVMAIAGSLLVFAALNTVAGIITGIAGAIGALALVVSPEAIVLVGIGALLTMLSTLKDMPAEVEAALILIGAAITGLAIACAAAMAVGTGGLSLLIGGLAAVVTSVAGFAIALGEQYKPEIIRFSDEISESTKTMLTPIIDNADEAAKALTELFITGKPATAEDTAEIAGYFTSMADEAVSSLERMKQSAEDNLTELFGDEAKAYEDSMKDIEDYYDDKRKEIEDTDQKLKDAVRDAILEYGEESAEVKVAQTTYEEFSTSKQEEIDKLKVAQDAEAKNVTDNLTQEQKDYVTAKDNISKSYDDRIKNIQTAYSDLKEDMKTYLAEGGTMEDDHYKEMLIKSETFLADIEKNTVDSNTELKTLAETRQTDLTGIVAEEVRLIGEETGKEYTKTVDDAQKTYNETVKLAEDTYKDRLAEIKSLREDGEIESDGLMNSMIDDATKTRDDTITAAQKMKTDTINEAFAMKNGVVEKFSELDTDIQSEVDKMESNKMNDFFNGIVDNAKDIIGSIKEWWGNFWDGLFGDTKDDIEDLESRGNSGGGRGSSGTSLYHYANGTSFHPGGLAIVGEEGPEIVRLPYSAQVIPTDISASIMSAMSTPFNASTTRAMAETGARMGNGTMRLDNSSIAAIVNGINESAALGMAGLGQSLTGGGQQLSIPEPDGTALARAIFPFLTSEANRLGYAWTTR